MRRLMGAALWRRLVMAGVGAAALNAGLAAPAAWAQEQTAAFDVPAQPMSSGLRALAGQARVSIAAPSDLVDGLNGSAVRGQMSLRTALNLLLAGSGLEAEFVDSNSVRIVRRTAGASAPQVEDEAAAELDDVVVVGSQIRGARPTGALPVTVLGTDDLDAVAATSGDELFRAIPQAGDVTFNETQDVGGSNDARGDTASINLRALGTGNTLVLLNGRRMVLHPGYQTENLVPVTTVNTNAIPVSGVERVEVLLDGAAAIYGTDAVAGVINTVLRNDFEGLMVEVGAGTAEGTGLDEYDLTVQWGRDFNDGRTNLSLFGDVSLRDPLYASERDYARNSDLRPLLVGTPFEDDTDFNNTSLDTPWAEFVRLVPGTFAVSTAATRYMGQTLTTSGVFHVQPTGNEGCIAPAGPGVCYDNASLSTASTDNNLRYNINDVRTLSGENDRYNLFAFLNHEFDNGVEFFAEAGGYYSDYNSAREQDTPLAAARIIIPANGYWNPLGPVGSPNRLPGLTTGTGSTAFPAAGAPLELQDYRPVDAGPQFINVTNLTTRYLAGLRGEVRGFDWESAIVYSRAETEDTSTGISNTAFQAAVARTTPDAYNPFTGGDIADPANGDATPNPQAVIDEFLIDVRRKNETTLAMWDVRVSRNDLIDLPAGPVGVAAGVELRRETFRDDRDARLDGSITFTNLAGETSNSDVMGTSATPDSSGARNVQSAWLEFAVPIVSPEMNIPLVRSIDLQIAGRIENYTAFGSVAKPKIALSYRPTDWLQFRTSWSQGFRAPSLPQQFENGVERSNVRTDLIRCEADVRAGRIDDFDGCSAGVGVISVRSGSQDLEPEESENFSAGFVFEPRFIPSQFGDLSFTADYWKIEQTDIIGIFGDANAIALDYLLRVRGGSNPNVVRADPTPEDIAAFDGTGLAPVGEVIHVIDNYVNLSPREVDGIDLGLYYDIDDTSWGDFSWRLNAAKLLTFFQEPGAEAQMLLDAQAAGEISSGFNIVGAESLIQENGRPEWRFSSTVTWRNGSWGAGLYSSYVSEVFDTGATLADGTQFIIDDFLTHNLHVQYDVEGAGWLDETRLRVGVRNIEGKDPPLADASFGYLGSLHSNRGRWFYATIRKRF